MGYLILPTLLLIFVQPRHPGAEVGAVVQGHRASSRSWCDEVREECVQVVAKKGFTECHARFLATVIPHAGVRVPR